MKKSQLGVAILMVFSIVVIPLLAYFFGTPLSQRQFEVLKVLIYVYVGVSATCFIISEITRNCSQVDKIWSLIPIIYVWIVAYMNHFELRTLLMASLVSIWGLRLTYNFARRGGYSWRFWAGEEDYRWAILRKDKAFDSPIKWFFFNLFFISFYQNALLLLITLPILLTVDSTNSLNGLDYVCALLILALIVFETLADQQQWNFQQRKLQLKKEGKPLESEFISEGLWKMSRHPNYFAEQSIWVVFYFFSIAAGSSLFNWSLMGALLLIVLFKGSSDFSEEITANKYPKYKDYQLKTPRFFPRFW